MTTDQTSNAFQMALCQIMQIRTEPIQRKGWSLSVVFSELSEPFFGVTMNSNKVIFASFAFSFQAFDKSKLNFLLWPVMKIIENLIKGLSSVEGLLLPVDFNVFMPSTFQARETAQLTTGSSAANKTIILFCFYSEYILRDIFQEKL